MQAPYETRILCELITRPEPVEFAASRGRRVWGAAAKMLSRQDDPLPGLGELTRIGVIFSSSVPTDDLHNVAVGRLIQSSGGTYLHPMHAILLAERFTHTELGARLAALAPTGAQPFARAIVWHPYLTDEDGFLCQIGLDASGVSAESAGAVYAYRYTPHSHKDSGDNDVPALEWPKPRAKSETVFLFDAGSVPVSGN